MMVEVEHLGTNRRELIQDKYETQHAPERRHLEGIVASLEDTGCITVMCIKDDAYEEQTAALNGIFGTADSELMLDVFMQIKGSTTNPFKSYITLTYPKKLWKVDSGEEELSCEYDPRRVEKEIKTVHRALVQGYDDLVLRTGDITFLDQMQEIYDFNIYPDHELYERIKDKIYNSYFDAVFQNLKSPYRKHLHVLDGQFTNLDGVGFNIRIEKSSDDPPHMLVKMRYLTQYYQENPESVKNTVEATIESVESAVDELS